MLGPDPGSRRLKAGCHAGRKQVSAGTAPEAHTNNLGFDIVSVVTTLHQRFTCVRLPGPHLTRYARAFWARRSPRWLLTTAARADLQPEPVLRLREAVSHPKHSFSLHTVCPEIRACANPGRTKALSIGGGRSAGHTIYGAFSRPLRGLSRDRRRPRPRGRG
jgi:hypothetical protein